MTQPESTEPRTLEQITAEAVAVYNQTKQDCARVALLELEAIAQGADLNDPDLAKARHSAMRAKVTAFLRVSGLIKPAPTWTKRRI